TSVILCNATPPYIPSFPTRRSSDLHLHPVPVDGDHFEKAVLLVDVLISHVDDDRGLGHDLPVRGDKRVKATVVPFAQLPLGRLKDALLRGGGRGPCGRQESAPESGRPHTPPPAGPTHRVPPLPPAAFRLRDRFQEVHRPCRARRAALRKRPARPAAVPGARRRFPQSPPRSRRPGPRRRIRPRPRWRRRSGFPARRPALRAPRPPGRRPTS